MRIAISGLAAKSGGALTYLVNLLPELATAGEGDEFIIYLNEIGAPAVVAKIPRSNSHVRIVVVPNVQHAHVRIAWEHLKFAQELRAQGADVLFVYWPSVPSRCPCPAVVAVHNMEPYCVHVTSLGSMRDRLRHVYLRWTTEHAMRRAAAVILLAEATGALLSRWRPIDVARTAVVPNGRDPHFQAMPKDQARARMQGIFGLREPFLLCVSDTRPYKNYLRLVEAFALMRRHGVRHHLVVAGELCQPHANQVRERVVAAGLSNVVHFLQKVRYELLPVVYNASDLFVFPSLCEACPIAVIEAMACRLPLAVSEIPVLRELCADTVAYFDPLDTEGIAEVCEDLLAAGQRREELGARASQRAQNFSWRRTAERILALLRRAARDQRLEVQ